MTEMFGEAWSPMSVPDLAPDDDDDDHYHAEVPNFRINPKIRILSGYFNKPFQCGLNFLLDFLKNFLLFFVTSWHL